MKIGMMHLSDLHLDSSFCINNEIEDRMIEALLNLNVNNLNQIFLIITGDLAKTGAESDYKKVTKFISSIEKKIKNAIKQNVRIVVIPGNHDICFENNYSDNLARFENSKYLEQDSLKKEIKRMDNFFSFSKKYSIFEDNKKYDFITYENSDFRVNFCLINSAMFSLRDSQSDKGYHNISESILSEIEQSSTGNLNILLTHHDFSWFDWPTRTRLENICSKYYSIVLYGHDHYAKIQKVTQGNSMDTLYIQGDETIKDNTFFNFSFYIYNSDINSLDVNIFNYNNKNSLFLNDKQTFKLEYKTKENRILQLNQDFEDELLDSGGDSKSFLEYFIFPKLSYYTNSENNKKNYISNYNELKLIINDKKIVNFTGVDCVGKTSLLKYLFLKEINGGSLPIRINKDDLKIEKDALIKKCFNRQYCNSGNEYKIFDAFVNKVLFIDDFESIKNSEKLLEYFNDKFEKIFIFNNKSIMSFAAKDELLNKYRTYDNYLELDFCRFSKKFLICIELVIVYKNDIIKSVFRKD